MATATKASARETVRQALDEVVQQELAALVADIAAELGVPVAPDDAAAIADDAAATIEDAVGEAAGDETMMALPEDDEEAKRKKSIAVYALAIKHLSSAGYRYYGQRKQAKEEARKDAQKAAREQHEKSLPGVAKTGNHTNGNQGIESGQKGRPADILVSSKYQNWDARDFSFALNIAKLQRGTNKRLINLDADKAFFREFADKAAHAYQQGRLHLSAGAVKSINAMKSDELDYSTQDGFGDELVPTIWSEDIWLRPRQDNVIQNIFESIEMQGNPYEYPVESTDPTVYFVAETKHDAQLSLDSATRPIPSSKVATNKVTFSAKKFGLQVEWSAELDEDAIGRLVPQFRAQSERAMQDKGIDNVAINGDTSTTTNINADGETITATTRNYLAYDGLIHQPLVTATTNRLDASGAAPTLQHLRSVRSLLGTPEAYNPQNLAWIMDFPTYAKLLSDDNVVTVDKYGSAATVLTGELGRVDGIPVFVSAEMALADADGKITDGGNVVSRGRAILVHRQSWKLGFLRRITQSLDFLPYFDIWILTITMRNHFLPRTATDGALQSTDDSTGILYNIGV